MNTLRIAENIAFLRKQKGITQDELASFLGVTKASVSKWENRQSMPDIILLPKIATYFDITVDELLGYEPQLSKEQIQKLYTELSENFAKMSFEEAFARSEVLTKKYYSCYRFLLQVCTLWLNHHMLAETKERQNEILEKLERLCEHILINCKETEICSDILGVKAYVDLLRGQPQNVIDGIGNLLNPNRILNQSDALLIQAYIMAGDMEKADSFTQAMMYLHTLMLVGDAVHYLNIHMQEKDVCEETITRMDKIIETYKLDGLNANTVASYQYQVAVYNAIHGQKEEAARRLQKYVDLVCSVLKVGMLHGDSYFSKLDSWFEKLDLGPQMPRSKKIILQSVQESLKNPVFADLQGVKDFVKYQYLFQ